MIIDFGPLTIKVDVLIVQLINLAVLFWVFKKLFGDTLVREIAKRKELTKRLEQAETEYQSLIAKAQDEREQILEDTLAQKNQILQEAKELADKEKVKLLGKAEDEASLILQKAQQDLELQSRDLDANFVQGVKTTSLAMIKKLFASNKNIQESYLQGLVDEFSASYKK